MTLGERCDEILRLIDETLGDMAGPDGEMAHERHVSDARPTHRIRGRRDRADAMYAQSA